ncbi:MAG: HlyD family efflux transporter periplasmic adaptor subunit [Candidatus Dormibacteraeota bacterium]|nr:HlyD family efflux transporter periplasmic adaptor subunit [Candidatus Dormibacteraeota bacterium]
MASQPGGRRPRRDLLRNRRVLAGAGIAVIVAGIVAAVLVVVHPFGAAAAAGSGDNGAATGIATVQERPLSSQTAVAGTLGYGGTSNVVAPNGTTQQALTQAQQQVTQAQNSVAADQTSLSDGTAASDQTLSQDESAVSSAQSSLNADQSAENTDCATPSSPACTADKQAVAQDQSKLTQAQNQLASAQSQATQSHDQNASKLSADESALANAQSALATADASAVNPGTTYTSLPAAGTKVTQGQSLYSVGGVTVPLFYGNTTLYRDLQLGVSDGADVGELTANLIALGFGSGLTQSNHFSDATQAAVEQWQASIGAPQTGVVHLGDVVVEPAAVIVTSVTPSVGGAVQPGATIMQVTSTTRQVTVALDVGQQGQVKAGDAVTITLPNNRTTTGTVSFVGSVATTPSNSGNGGNNNNATPTIAVDITLNDPSATGNLDQAPVEVSITTASVPSGLVVPVTALVALSGGGYAVEVVSANGAHHLVAVQPGLFDDADGLVQVTGDGLAAGQHIVVPAQ